MVLLLWRQRNSLSRRLNKLTNPNFPKKRLGKPGMSTQKQMRSKTRNGGIKMKKTHVIKMFMIFIALKSIAQENIHSSIGRGKFEITSITSTNLVLKNPPSGHRLWGEAELYRF